MMPENLLGVHQKIDLLGIPGYFYCDKTHCTLRAEICIKRQQVNQISLLKNDTAPFLICRDCDWGERIQKSRGNDMEG